MAPAVTRDLPAEAFEVPPPRSPEDRRLERLTEALATARQTRCEAELAAELHPRNPDLQRRAAKAVAKHLAALRAWERARRLAV